MGNNVAVCLGVACLRCVSLQGLDRRHFRLITPLEFIRASIMELRAGEA